MDAIKHIFDIEINTLTYLMHQYELGKMNNSRYFDNINILLCSVNNKIIDELSKTARIYNDDLLLSVMDILYSEMNKFIYLLQYIFNNQLIEYKYIIQNLNLNNL